MKLYAAGEPIEPMSSTSGMTIDVELMNSIPAGVDSDDFGPIFINDEKWDVVTCKQIGGNWLRMQVRKA